MHAWLLLQVLRQQLEVVPKLQGERSRSELSTRAEASTLRMAVHVDVDKQGPPYQVETYLRLLANNEELGSSLQSRMLNPVEGMSKLGVDIES